MTRILRGMLDEATNGSGSPRLTRTQRYWSERANAETPQYAREVARDQGGIRVGAVNVQTINTTQGQTPAGGGGSSSGQRQGGGSGG